VLSRPDQRANSTTISMLLQASHPTVVSIAAGDDWLDSRRVARKRAAAAAGAAAKTAAAQELLDKRTLETANPERAAAALSVARSVPFVIPPCSAAGGA